MEIKGRYWWKFNVKSEPNMNARSIIAWLFRRIATAIDGLPSLSLEMESTPVVSKEERVQIMHAGLDLSKGLFKDAAKRESLEEMMREHKPHLFREDSCKTKS